MMTGKIAGLRVTSSYFWFITFNDHTVGLTAFKFSCQSDETLLVSVRAVVSVPAFGLVLDRPRNIVGIEVALVRNLQTGIYGWGTVIVRAALVQQVQTGSQSWLERPTKVFPFHRWPVDVEVLLDVLDVFQQNPPGQRALNFFEHFLVDLYKHRLNVSQRLEYVVGLYLSLQKSDDKNNSWYCQIFLLFF